MRRSEKERLLKVEERIRTLDQVLTKHMDGHRYNYPTRSDISNYVEDMITRTTVKHNDQELRTNEVLEALLEYLDLNVEEVQRHLELGKKHAK